MIQKSATFKKFKVSFYRTAKGILYHYIMQNTMLLRGGGGMVAGEK